MSGIEIIESALQRRSDSQKKKFFPFAPVDNTTQEKYDTEIFMRENEQQLNSLLTVSYIDYFSHWMYNETLHKFVLSYLLFRNRPLDPSQECSSDLFVVDQAVSIYLLLQDNKYLMH